MLDLFSAVRRARPQTVDEREKHAFQRGLRVWGHPRPKPDDPASIRPIFSGRYHEHQYEIDQRGLDAGPSWLGFGVWGLRFRDLEHVRAYLHCVWAGDAGIALADSRG